MLPRNPFLALGLTLLALGLSPSPAQAANGFSLALDFGAGSFGAKPEGLAEQVGNVHARQFTEPIDGLWTPAAALRLGWNFFGHALLEGTISGTTWYPSDSAKTGGGGFAGGRLSWFPLELLHPLNIVDLRDRNYDFGLTFGSGYTLLGGPKYGMSGAYLEYGAVAQFYPLKWLSTGLFYRYHQPLFSTFYEHFYEGISRPVDNYSIGWGVLGVSVGFHLTPR